jgi:hypothetical protein
MMDANRYSKAMHFVEPNSLHRTGFSVGEDHGFADELSLGMLRSMVTATRQAQLTRRSYVTQRWPCSVCRCWCGPQPPARRQRRVGSAGGR